MTRIVDHIFIHASATPYGRDHSAADIDRWHRAQGWLGCGYHFVIRIDGTIESAEKGNRCRPVDKAGAHVGSCGPGWNKRSIGICLIGGTDDEGNAVEDGYTQEQYDALYELICDLELEFPDCTILGHRDLIKLTGSSPKACPCFDVTSWLEEYGRKELEFMGLAPFNANFH